jgi:hypothetical protein
VEEKAEGSKSFSAGNVEEAETHYIQSLTLLDAAKSNGDVLRRKDFKDIFDRMETTELILHLNLAACALAQKRYEEALEEAKLVLKIDPKNVKAMYRAGKALCAMSKFEEAVVVLKEANKLSPSDKHITALFIRARKDHFDVSKSQQSTFGGMFSKSSYIMERGREAAQERSAKAAERKSIEPKLRGCIQSSNEVSLLDRWVANGIVSLDEEEAQRLLKVAQRSAAMGQLDQASERDLLSRHGLRIDGNQKDEGIGEERQGKGRALDEEQQELLMVHAITNKCQEGHSLTAEEADFLQTFRRKEIGRLEQQLQTTGLGEQDTALLKGLRAQEVKFKTSSIQCENNFREVEALLKQIETGRRIPVRQRLRMDELLQGERMRLEKKDDEQELTSQEWKLLQQVQKYHQQKKKDEDLRRQKVEQRKKVMGMT